MEEIHEMERDVAESFGVPDNIISWAKTAEGFTFALCSQLLYS